MAMFGAILRVAAHKALAQDDNAGVLSLSWEQRHGKEERGYLTLARSHRLGFSLRLDG